MPFRKVTYNARFRRAAVYSEPRCNFRCRGCSYGVKPPEGKTRLPLQQVQEVLAELAAKHPLERVHFLGGEPTLNPDLGELARFVHEKLGLFTKIGHSNGSRMPPPHIDAVSVSIKALDDGLHRDYTGVTNEAVLANFRRMYERGLTLDVSTVFIPGYVDIAEVERIARFVASVDPEISFHITGYVPVPGAPWRGPTREEVEKAAATAQRYLVHVTFSCLSPEDLHRLPERDVRYRSVRVA